MRSGNPVLPESTFTDVARGGYAPPMTLGGVIHRSVLLLLLVAGVATAVWAYASSNPGIIYPAVMAGAFGGFLLGIVTSFKRTWAPVTAPLYAALEGLFIGGFSLAMEQRFPGLVLQAVLLTFGVMFALLAAYQSRIIRPSETFKSIIVGIAALNLVLDFDFIENGVAYGAPKWMEWYAAFGLTVTLVWLYIEVLRLLTKLRRD